MLPTDYVMRVAARTRIWNRRTSRYYHRETIARIGRSYTTKDGKKSVHRPSKALLGAVARAHERAKRRGVKRLPVEQYQITHPVKKAPKRHLVGGRWRAQFYVRYTDGTEFRGRGFGGLPYTDGWTRPEIELEARAQLSENRVALRTGKRKWYHGDARSIDRFTMWGLKYTLHVAPTE